MAIDKRNRRWILFMFSQLFALQLVLIIVSKYLSYYSKYGWLVFDLIPLFFSGWLHHKAGELHSESLADHWCGGGGHSLCAGQLKHCRVTCTVAEHLHFSLPKNCIMYLFKYYLSNDSYIDRWSESCQPWYTWQDVSNMYWSEVNFCACHNNHTCGLCTCLLTWHISIPCTLN